MFASIATNPSFTELFLHLRGTWLGDWWCCAVLVLSAGFGEVNIPLGRKRERVCRDLWVGQGHHCLGARLCYLLQHIYKHL